jgi:D-alanyl-D-alanine carboxypeptidase
MDYSILINKKEKIKEHISKDNLVLVKSLYKDNMLLEKETYNHWLSLKDSAKESGLYIEIESAYRSFEYQTKILNDLIKEKGENYAYKAVAMPGHSEHETGLALDYCIYKDGNFIIEHDIILYEGNEYVNLNAHKHGFIIRYPKGKEEITGYFYEPWHLRYVGKELAIYLYKNNLTLEEYHFKEA